MSTSRRNQPSNLTGYPWPGSQAQYYTGTGTPRGNAVDFLSGTLANVNIQDQSYRPNAAAYTQSSAYGPFRGGAGGGSAYHYQNIPNNVGGQTHMYAPTAYSPRDNLGHVDSSARQEGKGLKEKNRERDAIRDKASSSRKQSFESGNSPPDTHYLDGYDPFYQFSSMDPTTAATSSLNYPSSLVTTTATTFQGGESSYSPQASQGAADVSFSSPQTSTAGSRNYQVFKILPLLGRSHIGILDQKAM
ncbi:hypothetical protein B0T17DRAFT_53280 [Bombardia bombarda]|uniref:Uncharacterized protein n=1 Tax=Bombardia bombarda TaxID=252184 RepID=A0AA39XKI3_9PEZI|nr:hypothetical protein B0T17DRAFT_53280 [Bombardia bombarda]